MINYFLLFLTAATLAGLQSLKAEPTTFQFSDWKVATPAVANTASGPTWGTPGCVASGPNGTILFSDDGLNWETSNSPLETDQVERTFIGQFAFGAGHFVGTGSNRQERFIIRSDDGKNWNVDNPENFGFHRSLVFANSLFVAITDRENESPQNQYDTLQVSSDGRTWNSFANPLGIQHITYGLGHWVGHSLTNGIYKTTNFIDWIEVQTPPPAFQQHFLRHLVFVNNRFFLLGAKRLSTDPHVLFSDDGDDWSELIIEIDDFTPGPQFDCIFTNGLFQMFGSKLVDGIERPSVIESTDGMTWTESYQLADKKERREGTAFYSATIWPDRPTITSNGTLHHQSPQEAWTSVDASPNLVLGDIEFANGVYVGTGGFGRFDGTTPDGAGIISSSSDLETWSHFTPDVKVPLNSVTFGNGTWVAVGPGGLVFTSIDGFAWIDQTSPSLQANFRGISFGAEHFIAYAANENRIYRSSDGIAWIEHDVSLFSRINDLIYANGRFVAVGDRAGVQTSINGIDWTYQTVGREGSLDTDEIDFETISFGKGRWITTAINDEEEEFIAYSDNGNSWAIIRVEIAPRKIVYSQGWFIGSGFRVSRNGLKWKDSQRTFDELKSATILVTNNRFVALSSSVWHGTLQFAKPSSPTYFPGDTVEIPSRENFEYRIQSSSDLSIWTSHGDWKPGNGDYLMWNPFESGRTEFWRILSRVQ